MNPFAVQAPDSVDHTLSNAGATCLRFNQGKGIFVGHYIAAGRTDGTVVVLSVETKGVLRLLDGHAKPVTSVCWSTYNRYLASSGQDWNVIVWDMKTAKRKRTLRFDAPVASVQFCPSSSNLLVVVLQTQQAYVIDLRRRKRASMLNGTADLNGIGASYSQPGASAASERRTELGVESKDAGTMVSAAFATDDSDTIVVGTSKGDLLAFDVKTAALLHRTKCGSSSVRQLAFDRLGRTIVANFNDRTVRLYSYTARPRPAESADDGTTSGEPFELLHRFQDKVNRTPWSGIGFSSDGEFVYGGATHKAAHNIYIWDRNAGVLDKVVQGPRDSLVTVDWHPTRAMMASVSHTGAINVWFNPPTENWSAYAPGFEELDENVVYREREDEFDLEDEEEVTRRKQDEEEAFVDIFSLGPQQSMQARRRSRRWSDAAAGLMDEVRNEKEEESVTDDDDDDDEKFIIPVRMSLDLPRLDVED